MTLKNCDKNGPFHTTQSSAPLLHHVLHMKGCCLQVKAYMSKKLVPSQHFLMLAAQWLFCARFIKINIVISSTSLQAHKWWPRHTVMSAGVHMQPRKTLNPTRPANSSTQNGYETPADSTTMQAHWPPVCMGTFCSTITKNTSAANNSLIHRILCLPKTGDDVNIINVRWNLRKASI